MLIGDQRPRLQAMPVYITSIGTEIIELAGSAGLHLDNWQQYQLNLSMGVTDKRMWSAFEVLLIVSRQNGKGSILEARELAALYLIETDRLALHTAHEHKTSAEHYIRIRSLIQQTPELERKVKRESAAYGREFIELIASPTIIIGSAGKWVRLGRSHRLLFIARSGGSGRGFTGDLLVYDEAMVLDAGKVSASMPSLFARPNPQIWYAGSAGLSTSTQLAAVRRRGKAAADKGETTNALAYMEWSIEPHTEYCKPGCTLHDDVNAEESIAKANPGYGIRLTADILSKAKEAFSEDPEGYQREVLGIGQYPAPDEAWLVVPKDWWDNTADYKDEPGRVRQPVFAVAVSPNRKHGAIGVAGARADGTVGIQIIEYEQGTKWIVDRAAEIAKRHGPATKWIVDPHGAAGSLIDEMEERHLKVIKVNATEVAHACGNFYDGLRDRWLWHYGNDPNSKVLYKALAGVDRRPLSNQWAWDYKNSAYDICSLNAVTLALWGFMKFKTREPAKFTIETFIAWAKAGRYVTENAFAVKCVTTEGMAFLRERDMLTDANIARLDAEGIKVPAHESEGATEY